MVEERHCNASNAYNLMRLITTARTPHCLNGINFDAECKLSSYNMKLIWLLCVYYNFILDYFHYLYSQNQMLLIDFSVVVTRQSHFSFCQTRLRHPKVYKRRNSNIHMNDSIEFVYSVRNAIKLRINQTLCFV